MVMLLFLLLILFILGILWKIDCIFLVFVYCGVIDFLFKKLFMLFWIFGYLLGSFLGFLNCVFFKILEDGLVEFWGGV